MGQPAANEPTMEEILASIRQIIAEEENDTDQRVSREPEAFAEEKIDRGAALEGNDDGLDEEGPLTLLGSDEEGAEMLKHQGNEAEMQARRASDERTAGRSHGAGQSQSYREVDLDDDMIERRAMAGPGNSESATVNRNGSGQQHRNQSEAERFRGALMSPDVNDAVHASFERLKASFGVNMEEKTEKLLRPMLQEWLDENLPTLVERLVREEIERVARGE